MSSWDVGGGWGLGGIVAHMTTRWVNPIDSRFICNGRLVGLTPCSRGTRRLGAGEGGGLSWSSRIYLALWLLSMCVRAGGIRPGTWLPPVVILL